MFNGLSFLNKDENDFNSFHGATNEKANLADIFDSEDTAKTEDVNPTLKYRPPKAQQTQKTNDKSSWNVVIAKIVGAFKLLNDANTSLGQLGLAILSNSTEDTSKLILYKTKEQVLSTFLLQNSSKVYWKPPYLQYHDDMNGFWSLIFSTDTDSNEFLAKLGELCLVDRGEGTPSENDLPTVKEEEEIKEEEVKKVKDITIETEQVDKVVTAKPVEAKKSTNDKIDGGEQTDNVPAKTKSDVVFRVAKIGHQLPKMHSIGDDDSDSTHTSDTDRVPSATPLKSVYIPEKPIALAPSHLPPKPTNISVALQPQFWPSSSSTFDLNAFATENRVQNTEVRMNISKLDSKLDRVLDNIERLRLSSSMASDAPDREEEIIKLEEKMLELKKENRLLKLKLAESEQEKRTSNEKEKDELANMMKAKEENVLKITELTAKLEETEQTLRAEISAKDKAIEELGEKYTAELATLRDELEKKSKALETLEQSQKSANTNNGDTIRNIMNQFYVKLYQSIEGKTTMASADILKLTAEIIRKETKAALNSN